MRSLGCKKYGAERHSGSGIITLRAASTLGAVVSSWRRRVARSQFQECRSGFDNADTRSGVRQGAGWRAMPVFFGHCSQTYFIAGTFLLPVTPPSGDPAPTEAGRGYGTLGSAESALANHRYGIGQKSPYFSAFSCIQM